MRRGRTQPSADWTFFRRKGWNVRVIVFPGGQDPDEFVRANGKEGFDRLKEEALTLNSFKLKLRLRETTIFPKIPSASNTPWKPAGSSAR
ncbi:MAG: hypothetical protein R2912_12005 [Eubacteriales bacterium]